MQVVQVASDKQIGIAKARQKFGNIVESVQYGGEAFVISRNGKPVAAVVPVRVLEQYQREREELFGLIERVQAVNQNADPDEVMYDVLEAQQGLRGKQQL
ncbi:MAG: type II toxin-antitoxin system prevent-host-death family antitoxin [Anaerolineae bacterium]|nr:type II toxin-antitoxin system prevent-host-death family antitoxin [Anaerolineae bacterium]